ncbi:DUF3833 domain-containing protein [Oceaniglobus trochenteri]|uniref:DUF3833 domain-containing protein n=1 Tax=Oceaniglobus trochenteri TaxID=2763260 RepID=UPI001CFFF423|nr:DUF3833 domain-containing protein [Oceaniglobus trochenteri]
MVVVIWFLAGILLVVAVIVLRHYFASFSGQRPSDYDHLGPEFDLRRHLGGPLQCDGVIYGPGGRITSRFTADMTGSWDGAKGTLDQVFRYDNGERQERAWHLALDDEGRFRADAEDVIGTGRGAQSGPTVQLKYTIRLPKESGGHILNVIDWMYLVDQTTIINRSQFRKYGIKVAELVATIRPKDKT